MLCPLSAAAPDADMDNFCCSTAHPETPYGTACCNDEQCWARRACRWVQALNAALMGAAEPAQSADLVADAGEGHDLLESGRHACSRVSG